jgi:hypothetical protein
VVPFGVAALPFVPVLFEICAIADGDTSNSPAMPAAITAAGIMIFFNPLLSVPV